MNNPSRQYLYWYASILEEMLKENGHTDEEILAYVTNSLTHKEPQQ